MAERLVCPTCGEPNALVAVDRKGVIIDACPRCRGVWLDRGELDKLIELESAPDEDFLAEIRGDSATDASEHGGHTGSEKHGSGKHGDKSDTDGRKKRGSFLGDIFDLG